MEWTIISDVHLCDVVYVYAVMDAGHGVTRHKVWMQADPGDLYAGLHQMPCQWQPAPTRARVEGGTR